MTFFPNFDANYIQESFETSRSNRYSKQLF